MEKTIIVHVDALEGSCIPIRDQAIKRVQRKIKDVVDATDASDIERIDGTNPNPRIDATVYFIGDDVSADRAEEVIMHGDKVQIIGLYRDICCAEVKKICDGLGADGHIPEEGSFNMLLGFRKA